MSNTDGWMSGFRRPEYTGENRCLPCTAVNLVLSVLVAVAVGTVGAFAISDLAGLGLAIGVLVVSIVAIYLRGYLVPGTPELTKRYFPVWLLRWFGKARDDFEPVAGESALDPEEELVSIGALQECENADDLCLVPEFQEAWNAEIERMDPAETGRERLLEVLDIDEGDVSIDEYDDAFRARVEGYTAGTWESKAAYLTDQASARLLAERHPEWDELSIRNRTQLLSGLRLFVERCPTCGGTVAFGTETVESCCSSREVAAVECDDCGARLFESGPLG